MPHDVIDNRKEKLSDHIKNILGSARGARFAVGYFFLSGFDLIQSEQSKLEHVRLLIGNTSSRETIEQMSEGYRRLELVADAETRERYLNKQEIDERSQETAVNIRRTIELMDQTDENEVVVKSLIQLIQEGRLAIRVYTKEPYRQF